MLMNCRLQEKVNHLSESQFEAPEPPLTVRTPRGTYFIQLIWNPPIQATASAAASGNNNVSSNNHSQEEFGLIFMNNRQEIQDRVTYGFSVTSSNGTVIADLENQRAIDGTSTQTITFPNEGRYTIEVNVESVAGQPLGIFVESARFTALAE